MFQFWLKLSQQHFDALFGKSSKKPITVIQSTGDDSFCRALGPATPLVGDGTFFETLDTKKISKFERLGEHKDLETSHGSVTALSCETDVWRVRKCQIHADFM